MKRRQTTQNRHALLPPLTLNSLRYKKAVASPTTPRLPCIITPPGKSMDGGSRPPSRSPIPPSHKNHTRNVSPRSQIEATSGRVVCSGYANRDRHSNGDHPYHYDACVEPLSSKPVNNNINNIDLECLKREQEMLEQKLQFSRLTYQRNVRSGRDIFVKDSLPPINSNSTTGSNTCLSGQEKVAKQKENGTMFWQLLHSDASGDFEGTDLSQLLAKDHALKMFLSCGCSRRRDAICERVNDQNHAAMMSQIQSLVLVKTLNPWYF